MDLYRIQRQPWDTDLFDESLCTTVVTTADFEAGERLLNFMAKTYPEYAWALMFDHI